MNPEQTTNPESALEGRHIVLLFVIALMIRLVFDFYLQQFYFGDFVFKRADTMSFLNPIFNLMEHGTYMSDLYLEDSKYFRVPVYPGFLGLVHFVFGADHFDYAVACIQALLDSFSTVLVCLILFRITRSSRMALLSGFIYATYPFIIVWNPISYTEIVYMFLLWTLVYISFEPHSIKKTFFQGVLVGLLLLTKQTLGLTLLIPGMMILLRQGEESPWKHKALFLSVLLLGFLSVLTPWVARNYIQSGKLIVLMGDTPGIRVYGKDFQAFNKFAQLFNENITPIWDDVTYRGTAQLEKHPAFVDKYKGEIEGAFQLAYECGPSFVQRRDSAYNNKPPYIGCEAEVIQAFQQLTLRFWEEVPLPEAMETRADAMKKIYSKSNIISAKIKFSAADLIKYTIFKYRVLLLILGTAGIFWLIYHRTNRNYAIALFMTAAAAYVYFALIIVHVEIRYLLMPDLLISIFASVPIIAVLHKIQSRRSDQKSAMK